MKAVKIHIGGIVQGVGFRPYVYHLAHRLELKGWVINDSEGLRMVLEGEESSIETATTELRKNPPDLSRIKSFNLFHEEFQGFEDFIILKSETSERKSVLLSPDYAMCENCEEEIFDTHNRRESYAFTTCTKCGPRYSIIDKLPYDRENTTMVTFEMCPECQNEYDNVEDRRYYSQTNSCSKCGVELGFYRNGLKIEGNESELIRLSVDAILNGEILALKGIGGFLLVCDATNEDTILTLRNRKKRPSKPFALIYPGIEMLNNDVIVSRQQEKEYNSERAPIVLFRLKENSLSGIKNEAIAPGLDQIGVMRAYAPLLALISRQTARPMVATSANLSGSSIIYENKKALEGLSSIADAIICHNRDILIPEDDSLVSFSPDKNEKIILRRSRGMAPNYFGPRPDWDKNVIACGASLKSSFCIHNIDNTYISQYLGDLDSYDSQLNYQNSLNHMLQVLDFRPQVILCDKHPQYASTAMAADLADEYKAKLKTIQHHEAHFAAVLAENDIIESREKILGVIWDGTGFGNDSNIWGGEFFLYRDYSFQRIDHFDYYPHILGDKMPREPRISALSILRNSAHKQILEQYFSEKEWKLYNRILNENTGIKSSSTGRIFDAVACMLGLGDKISYEGEAALKLEQLALRSENREFREIEGDWMNPQNLLESIALEMAFGRKKEDIAFDFHLKLIYTIKQCVNRYDIRNLAFSGGVFQNSLLRDLVIEAFDERFKLYFHKELSPNDECISFGQLMHYYISERHEMVGESDYNEVKKK